MKTTTEIDEAKLKRVMGLTGIRTRRGAIDFALNEAERLARIRKIAEEAWRAEDLIGAMDPSYELAKLREQETLGDARSR